MTTTSYPGIYIEEIGSPNLVIRSSPNTAVPIIACAHIPTGAATKIYSFQDFKERFSEDVGDHEDTRYIQAYFECGGGPCYVVYTNSFLTEIPKYSDITLLVPAGNTSLNAGAATACKPGSGLFAILDYANAEITGTDAAAGYPVSMFAAVYYPWFTASWTSYQIPPGVIMAGLYCASDRTRGVWKAPANIALPADYQPRYPVTDDLQGQYNSGKAINMIRKVDDRGILVWGARTLEDSPDWRYISVRRLFNSAERDIKTSLQSMVFEPNNQPTWEKVRSAINNYLYGLWRQGALVGATEQQAYFVKIGKDITMSADDIAQGQMIAQVGMAATRPAEFIILQFTQDVAPA